MTRGTRSSRDRAERIHLGKLRVDSPACYWEITDRCPMRCVHCWCPHKTRTGPELGTDEALRFCDELAGLGTRTVHLTGGEPLMRGDWARIAGRLRDLGIEVHLRTSGVGLGAETLATAVAAGVRSVTIPLDGPAAIHNEFRPPLEPDLDPHRAATEAIRRVLAAGLALKVATQVNKRNLPHLDVLCDELVALGVGRWKIQLCRPDLSTFGHSELYLHPLDLPTLFEFLEAVHRGGRIELLPAHTLGYFTRAEPLLRPQRGGRPPIWTGCEAGLKYFTVECDGRVKGCIAQPSEFAVASIRERSIADIWRDDACFAYTRQWDDRWFGGECQGCSFRDLCRAGCTAVAYGASGSVGYNPYCLHRVTNLI